jgi:hypothetical protein
MSADIAIGCFILLCFWVVHLMVHYVIPVTAQLYFRWVQFVVSTSSLTMQTGLITWQPQLILRFQFRNGLSNKFT